MEPIDDFDLEEICYNCSKEHGSKFSSEWDWHSPSTHYKAIKCQHCNYETNIRTKGDTSGLDHI